MNRQTKLIIFIFCVIKLALHLIADFHSGFGSDEFLHIEAGNHLALGYMEFPPMIGLLAFVQNLFHSQSVFVHHIFSHVTMLLIVIYLSKITLELGGKSIAVFVVLFCFLVAPGFESCQQLFEPVAFSQLFWVLCFYQLTRFIKHNDVKYLWNLTIFVSLFFLTKYDALFFSFGLLTLLLFRVQRAALTRYRYWRCLIVAFLILAPNIIWQYVNDFPALQMFHRLYETQLDDMDFPGVLHELFLSVNPVCFVLILPGLVFMFSDKRNSYLYKPLAGSILLSLLFLAYCKGKAYYFYPIVMTMLPFCGIFWERVILAKRNWVLYPLSFVLLLGSVLIPFGMPVYSFHHYLNSVYKYYSKEVKNGKRVLVLQQYDTKAAWEIVMQELKSVYDSLPDNEKKHCLIWGKHYSQAGAVELFRKTYGLPHAFSYHGSFYSWAPTGEMPETIIAFCYNDAERGFFAPFFHEVIPVRRVYRNYASSEGWVNQTIFICKKPRQSFDRMKVLFRGRIFE